VDADQVLALNRLLDEWDPIGVYDGFDDQDDRPPSGEYERLVNPILTKLRAGDSARDIAAYLTWDVRTNMDLASRPDADLAAAERIYAWYHGSRH
jgi:hypothetical protein